MLTTCYMLLLLAVLQTGLGQEIVKTTLSPQTISGSTIGSRSCPSLEERERARQTISNSIQTVLLATQDNFSITVACGSGQWHQVAFLNMSDSSQQCPSSWSEYTTGGVRACGRSASSTASCSSTVFSTSSSQYSRVCGRIIGYQVGSTDVFAKKQLSIDSPYVDGVSVTHGTNTRTHIWTNVAGLFHNNNVSQYASYACPCALEGTSFMQQVPPSFIGNNYYCESGNPTDEFMHSDSLVYVDDPLWDGQQCEGQCCSNGKSPPWFSVQLPASTNDNIEVRICGTNRSGEEDTPIKLLDIYIQ